MVQRPSQVAGGGSHQIHKSNQNIHFSDGSFFRSLTSFSNASLSRSFRSFSFVSSCSPHIPIFISCLFLAFCFAVLPSLALIFIISASSQEFMLRFCRCEEIWWLTLTRLCIVASNSHRCSTEDLYLLISLLVMVIRNIPFLASIKS